ncbi:FadR/GntR family transcriptional regulator [Qingshengfaniella alkalisoli]|uniref:FadR/GntR family transcriptional regulator n=1 Tax=Qingshengfaniella alkalisoli TaxID=2599296 RepID=UPI00143CE7AD|nr:FadR/GntR family transcriptional regulator [Qingshengfaniella alkalisoli]
MAEELYLRVLELIVAGKFSVGDKLPSENEISKTFGGSRPVIRIALTRLREEGVITARQGVGYFVTNRPSADLTAVVHSDWDELSHINEVRQAIEPVVARCAAERGKRTQLDFVSRALDVLRERIEDGEAGSDADYAFHLSIAQASENDLFVSVLRSMRGQLLSSIVTTNNDVFELKREYADAIIQEHRDIHDAILAGNGQAAEVFMKYHLMNAFRRIRNLQGKTPVTGP